MNKLRSVKVTYSNGQVISTSMAAHLTDEEIHNYFKPGKVFNIGSVDDNVQAVVSCEIIKPLKGLIVEVYKSFQRDGKVSDCTNNGITSRVNKITLVGEGIPEIFEADEDAPAFKVVRRMLSHSDTDNHKEEYLHVEPIERPTGIGWMYGGNICSTSDSRFPNRYPLKIHDRQESAAQNRMLSV